MFLQAMRHEKPTNVRLGNPSCYHTHPHHLKMPLKMPLSEIIQDKAPNQFNNTGGWFGLGQLQVLGNKLPCMWPLVKYNFPSNTWAIRRTPWAALAQKKSKKIAAIPM